MVFKNWKMVDVTRFYPDFPRKEDPDYVEGRGRRLLELLLREFEGYEVVSYASPDFQKSFKKMTTEFGWPAWTYMQDRDEFQRLIVKRAGQHPDGPGWTRRWHVATLYGVISSLKGVSAQPESAARLAAYADPRAELENAHVRALFMGILLEWVPSNLKERLAILVDGGKLVAGFAEESGGYRVSFYEASDADSTIVHSAFFSKDALAEFKRQSALAASGQMPAGSLIGVSEAALVRNEEHRQSRVFLSALAQATDRVEGVLDINVDYLDVEGFDITDQLGLNVELLIKELEEIRRDPRFAGVLFEFTGYTNRVEVARKLGLGRFEAPLEAIRSAKRLVGWGLPEPGRDYSDGYVAVAHIKRGHHLPIRPLLYYSLYLLAIKNVPGDPHPFTPDRISDQVLREVSRLAGNPLDARLEREHVFAFAQGDESEEVIAIARRFMIAPLVQLAGARLAEYRRLVLAVGSSA